MILLWGVEYLATLVEIFMCLFFSKIFLCSNKDEQIINKFRVFIYSFISSFLVIAVNKIDLFSFLNGISAIILLCILEFIIFKRRYVFLVVLILIYSVIASAIDFVTVQIGAAVLMLKTSYLINEMSLERCVCVFVSKLFLIFLIYLIYKYMQNQTNIPKKYVLTIGCMAIILFVLEYYIIDKNATVADNRMKIYSIVFFLILIIFLLLIFNLVIKLTENFNQMQDIALLKLQNEMIIKSEKNTQHIFEMWRTSIHDYKHKIILMKHWIDNGEIESIKQFIDKENENIQQKMFYVKTGSDVVDVIVNTKQNIAEKKGINFSVNGVMPVSCIVSDIDLVCILGNIIDNAIEACDEQPQKNIEILIKEVKKLLIISVKNSFRNQLSEELKTTKKDRELHGIGIKNIKNIVQKYDGTYEIVKENNEVIATVMIPNK